MGGGGGVQLSSKGGFTQTGKAPVVRGAVVVLEAPVVGLEGVETGGVIGGLEGVETVAGGVGVDTLSAIA